MSVIVKLLLKDIHDVAAADDKAHRYEIKDVLEMEMRLLEALDYYLVIYHPYRPLIQ